MQNLIAFLQQALTPPLRTHTERGATAVEYALMVAAIATVIAAIVFVIGDQVQDIFTGVNADFTTIP